jgi:S1-C subfamily serine protease
VKKVLVALTLIAACAAPTKAVARRDAKPVARALHNTVALVNQQGFVFCSGVISNHVILTAWHCTDNGAMWARDTEGRMYQVEVLGDNMTEDLAALIRTDGVALGKGVPVARKAPKFAESIWVIGHPLGGDDYNYSITKGIVSHPRRTDGIFGGVWLQHDAGTLGGNSGGPVLNRFGRLVGITSFGVLEGVACSPFQDCRGIYQDTHIAGAAHHEGIVRLLDSL